MTIIPQKVPHYQSVAARNRWPIGGFEYFSQESTQAKIQPVSPAREATLTVVLSGCSRTR
jgi:hypothetical protein